MIKIWCKCGICTYDLLNLGVACETQTEARTLDIDEMAQLPPPSPRTMRRQRPGATTKTQVYQQTANYEHLSHEVCASIICTVSLVYE